MDAHEIEHGAEFFASSGDCLIEIIVIEEIFLKPVEDWGEVYGFVRFVDFEFSAVGEETACLIVELGFEFFGFVGFGEQGGATDGCADDGEVYAGFVE